ncbi:unnamed protein product [Bursaphelenchus okinawaensis]|uniref:non-specific serine/threonine protein kinase n=1 Tax=Bursaphelenchus okinawaensis TaxID=465554 RepID=A0A811LLM0_9BILA|nr:unnamed protein product [Bursaphelenchus okinawaensis]CAG9127798.1 unnamed protein product [Bursaphelenchus okinawaensis]
MYASAKNELDPTKTYTPNDFEFKGKLGKGQFADCYKAKFMGDGSYYAVKRIQLNLLKDQKSKEDCRKEMDLLKKLRHENIIRCYVSFEDKNSDFLFIVLELADGGDLHGMLKTFKKNLRLVPEKSIWKYFVQISRGLTYMHQESIMHRDIKPANVFITTRGVAKLGDLGLGRFFSMQTNQAHSFVGTPYYMSPERMVEQGYNFKSDIWSLGCLLYEMAALQSPFYAEKTNLYALVRKIERCDYPPIPSNLYSKQLQMLIENCICTDPHRRFNAKQVQTVAEHMNSHFSGRR